MQISQGQIYRIKNLMTGQWSRFECREISEHRGHHVVYGNVTLHDTHLPMTHGYVTIPSRPACFPLINVADPGRLVRFCDGLFKSLPLVLEQDNPITGRIEQKVIPNQQSLPGWLEFGYTTATIDIPRLKQCASKLIDLWFEHVAEGELSMEYRAAMAMAHAGAN
jgi:hypothetical protein